MPARPEQQAFQHDHEPCEGCQAMLGELVRLADQAARMAPQRRFERAVEAEALRLRNAMRNLVVEVQGSACAFWPGIAEALKVAREMLG